MKALCLLLSCAAALPFALVPTRSEAQSFTINFKRDLKEVKLDWLLNAQELWTVSPDEFEKKMGRNKFVWQDKERTRARFDPEEFKFTLMEENVGETLVNFKDGKVISVTISVLNKGDADDVIGKSAYTEAMTNMKTVVKAAAGVADEPRRKNEAVTKAEGFLWRAPKALYLLEGLFLEEEQMEDDIFTWEIPAHAEFVRLRIMPPQKQLGTGVPQVKTLYSRAQLPTRVKKEGSKVYIDSVPMVNQGQKGYCAVASFERVLRYYGADIDMHDLANLANTYGGTNPKEMKLAVEKIAKKISMATKEPMFMQVKQYLSLIKDYNRAADKAKMSKVKENWGFWSEMDSELLRGMRAKSPEFQKFKQEVVNNINKGVPLMWALHLGMFWEDKIEESYEANRYATSTEDGDDSKDAEEAKKDAERQAEEQEELRKKNKRPPNYMQGGHMRLIIGYDGKEGLIYYTDSWGPGHEMKKMKIEDAFTGTMALFILEPR